LRKIFSKCAGTVQTTKDYGYDIYGHRTTESVTPSGQASATYTYAYNVHDSVSLLLDPTGTAKTSYGYRPYGDLDTALTGGEPDKNNPFNPYRYAAKRFDSGSQTVDMGARRFSTDTSKFLQPDQFDGALANLSLGTDPLSQNRYSLAEVIHSASSSGMAIESCMTEEERGVIRPTRLARVVASFATIPRSREQTSYALAWTSSTAAHETSNK
jgi:RHS repeat-associated protein